MTELKSCPFCGGKARLFVGNGVRVICSKCYAGTRILTDNMEYESNAVEMVVEAWNRRADAAEKVAGIFKVPMADLVDIFSEIPAADVAPVVHGRWEWFDEETGTPSTGYEREWGWRCSHCKEELPDDYDDPDDRPAFRFCYNCGAKMDGGADNEA